VETLGNASVIPSNESTSDPTEGDACQFHEHENGQACGDKPRKAVNFANGTKEPPKTPRKTKSAVELGRKGPDSSKDKTKSTAEFGTKDPYLSKDKTKSSLELGRKDSDSSEDMSGANGVLKPG
jgi:hypothetical protein